MIPIDETANMHAVYHWILHEHSITCSLGIYSCLVTTHISLFFCKARLDINVFFYNFEYLHIINTTTKVAINDTIAFVATEKKFFLIFNFSLAHLGITHTKPG